ncbi:MAG: HAMP domain-containing sensor histidine kinase [Candidatus Sumerlaeales bacterium]|nr:HAMP domain-containing sensor histidine kinase [Candidatus Sumerlaeales bacterium]
MGLTFSQHFHEQVHGALVAVSTRNDFFLILGSLLIDPEMFSYSRVCYFGYDESSDSFVGQFILGAVSAREDTQLRDEWARRWATIADKLSNTHEYRGLNKLYTETYRDLWHKVRSPQYPGFGTFENVSIKRSSLPPTHILQTTAESSAVQSKDLTPDIITGLTPWLQEGIPVLAGRLVTRKGLQGIVIVSRRYEEFKDISAETSLFQWLINLASTTMDNIMLIEELTQTATRLAEIDRLKSSFLSIVSHELRTPMTSILGFLNIVESCKAGPLNEMQQSLLSRVYAQAIHMGTMVDDLLRLAAVETGGMIHADIIPVTIKPIVDNVVANLVSRTIDEGVEVHFVPRNIDDLPRILVDPTALERILQHLLDNALKFRRQDGEKHNITLEFEARKDRLYIGIRDNGIGMTEEERKNIFTKFYQIDSNLDRNYGGLGIGLSVVRLLLAVNNGGVTVESRFNEGSLFCIDFPIYHEDR